jgi:hypothetical protein
MVSRDELFKGDHFGGAMHSEALEIDRFNELWKRQLPRFLAVIRQSTELLGIEVQFSRHLNLIIGKTVRLPRLEPG